MNTNISTRETPKNGDFHPNSTAKCAPMSPQCSVAPLQCAVKAGLAHSKTPLFTGKNPNSPRPKRQTTAPKTRAAKPRFCQQKRQPCAGHNTNARLVFDCRILGNSPTPPGPLQPAPCFFQHRPATRFSQPLPPCQPRAQPSPVLPSPTLQPSSLLLLHRPY